MDRPNDVLVQITEISAAYPANYPDWFTTGRSEWKSLLVSVANAWAAERAELDQMKLLNGRLLRRLAGD